MSHEIWPELDLWWRVSPDWRLSMFLPFSENIETEYREGNLVLQADYALGTTRRPFTHRLMDEEGMRRMRPWLIRGGYLGGRSLDDDGQSYEEDMLFGELHLRTPLARGLLASSRLRGEARWLGQDSESSNRWRYRLMFEKEFKAGRSSLVPYVNAEFYYDSRYSSVTRSRWIAGTSLSWSPRFMLEGNLTYQHDSQSSVTDLYALNLILHGFL